ncbi:ATP-binding protein [Serratia entomophila]|uniref:ATP-binding protein n=1 Tax=Serratia entomophila TaxID=42906 RepID=UPI002178073D|nr:ATP-binding protein [Serratia entomophila]CAI1561639.1 ATP-dependent zinc metalloprotease FtsH 3 [Serratia entomophila]
MKIDLTEAGVGGFSPAPSTQSHDPLGGLNPRAVPDALVTLGPWLEYVDLVLQGLLLWQQNNEEDRLNMAGLLLSPDALAETLARPTGLPYWLRQPGTVPWLERVQVPPVEGRLAEVVERFGLTPFETQVLVLGVLPLLDTRYDMLIAYLQGEGKVTWPGIDLALMLFSTNTAERMAHRLTLCSRSGALLREGLVSTIERNGRASGSSEAVYLRLDAAVFHFLCGEPAITLQTGLSEAARWDVPLNGVALCEGAWSACAKQLQQVCFSPLRGGATPLVLLLGGQGRAALMGQLAREAGRPMLVLALEQLPTETSAAWTVLRAVLRAVRLYAGVLILRGWTDGREEHRVLLDRLEPYLVHHGQPIVCLVSPDNAGSVWPGMARLSITLPPRGAKDERALLQEGLPPKGAAHDWDWDGLLRRTGVDPDGLAQTWQEAQGYRLLRDPAAPLTERDMQQALQIRGQQHFGQLAQRVRPRRTFDDLIAGADLTTHLREILAAIRQREGVLERGFDRKVGYGTGISALFYGESGTGKTMAAEVLAGELGLDLIRVDLSTVVNKYIGETEKNLSKIFDLAVADTGVLLFDEADALFGKRSEVKDAQDRHANIEVSYLLQRLEQYPGLVVLTTNNRAHLDAAFTRRLTFMTRFDTPDAVLRERMWRAIWPADIGVDDDVDWGHWAAMTELTGAGIRNVALLASWQASEHHRRVSHADIERAVRRELGKTGRIMLPVSGGKARVSHGNP